MSSMIVLFRIGALRVVITFANDKACKIGQHDLCTSFCKDISHLPLQPELLSAKIPAERLYDYAIGHALGESPATLHLECTGEGQADCKQDTRGLHSRSSGRSQSITKRASRHLLRQITTMYGHDDVRKRSKRLPRLGVDNSQAA